MSTFNECLAHQKINAAYIRRNAAVMDLNSVVSQVKSLDKDNPKPRIFLQHEKELESLALKVKTENNMMVQLMLSAQPDISSDSTFTSDQSGIRASTLSSINVVDEYRTILETKGLVPSLAQTQNQDATSGEFSDMLKQLGKNLTMLTEIGKSQTEMSKKQVEAINASKGPKPVQPTFTPKGDVSDYLTFKNFLENFTYFVQNVPNNKDKLQWMLSSVKGDAYQIIKGLSLNADNYRVAKEKLEKKYLSTEKIQKAIFASIYQYKNLNPDKTFNNVLQGLTSLENNIQDLASVHGLECREGAADRLVSLIILSNLPGQLCKELVNITGSTYPTVNQIFANIEKAVDRVNLANGNIPSYPKLKNSEVSVNAVSDKSKRKKKKRSKPEVSETVVAPVVTPVANSALSRTKPQEIQDRKPAYQDRPKKGPRQKHLSCKLCFERHTTRLCSKYLSVEARKKAFYERFHMNPCEVCFAAMHKGSCNPYFVCSHSYCGSKQPHAIVLCPYNIEQSRKVANPVKVQTVCSLTSKMQRAVALETAIFSAHNSHAYRLSSDLRNVAVLCDTGAQRSLVTKECADRLSLKKLRIERACLLGYGQKSSQNSLYEIVEIVLWEPDGKKLIYLEAMVVKSLNSIQMAGASLFAKKIHYNNGIALADWRFLTTKSDIVKSDLLVGADYYRSIVCPLTRPRQVLGMWLSHTVFGKVMLGGCIPGNATELNSETVNNITILNIPISLPILEEGEYVEEANAFDIVRQMNCYDSLGIRLSMREEEDKEADEVFSSKLQYDSSGQPFVGFPWVNRTPPSPEELHSNYEMVRSRFDAVMNSLDKNPEKREQYKAVHDAEVKSGFVEPVPESELNNPSVAKYFLNHFPVYREGSTTACRRVYDASMHRKGKSSLNDLMHKGACLTPDILEIMLRLRLSEFLLTADISKAFCRVGLREADRNYTLFFVRKDWENPKSPITVWRFRSVPFGASASPFLLNSTVADILKHNKYPENLEIFVDNLFALVEEKKNLLPAISEMINIFQGAGMPLHEFASNVPEVNDYLKEKDLLSEKKPLKLLGVHWDFESDMWYIVIPEFEIVLVTKRSILSDIARVFDVIGFFGPILILGRLLVQKAWDSDLSWDDLLPEDMRDEWKSIVVKLKDALQLPVPRWTGFKDYRNVSVHCFTDASEKALGVVIYLVYQDKSVFFTGKAKICPIKQSHFTIPRKELCAFSLGARYLGSVINSVSKYFTPQSVHLWSDSTTTLQWVCDSKSNKELYIRSRVDEIQKKIAIYSIKVHYVLGSVNPSDLLTKPSKDPIRSALWTNGPDLLKSPEKWQEYIAPKPKLDSVPIYCGAVHNQDVALPDIAKFHTLSEVLTATAELGREKGVSLTPACVAAAELSWLKQVQRKYYLEAYQFLCELNGVALSSVEGKKIVRSKKLTAPQICHSLHLSLDSDGLIRVNTSLANAQNLTYDQRFPILVNGSDPFALLLIEASHRDVGHMGLNYTRAHLRRRYWIPNVTCAIKRIIASCDTCKIERGKRYHVADSPALPEFRFNVAEPWNVVALDMTGHEWVAEGADKEVSKVYFLFFVCVSTGSGHVEMLPDASSSSFANAFDRFISRRGLPIMLISDHGSNFKGYETELRSLCDDPALESFLYEKGMIWRWTPIGAPHMNGYVERQLAILKSVIRRVLKNRVLTKDQLLTIACYSESLFNERPLCIMDGDVDLVPLTPNMLVYGRSLRRFPHVVSDIDLNDPDFSVSRKSLTVMAQKLKSTLQRVRKVWFEEYLHFLASKDSGRRANAPSTKSRLMPAVGDAVLIKDGKDVRLGRVSQLFLSDDSECRSVRVRTKSGGEGCYPVCNLRFLERGESNERSDIVIQVPKKGVRPQRKAALKAQEKFLSIHLLSL